MGVDVIVWLILIDEPGKVPVIAKTYVVVDGMFNHFYAVCISLMLSGLFVYLIEAEWFIFVLIN